MAADNERASDADRLSRDAAHLFRLNETRRWPIPLLNAPIRSIAILGAGAMGGLYASHFAAHGSFDVQFVAAGGRAMRLRDDGLRVNGAWLDFTVADPGAPAPAASADLVLVAVKHHDMTQALEDCRSIVGEETTFISVMNGLDSEEAIAAAFGVEKVLYCVALGMDAERIGNDVRFRQPGRLVFGEAENSETGARVRRVQEALDRAGLAWDTPADMLRALWWKFMVNVGINQASAVMRAPYGVFKSSDPARFLMDALIGEVVELSRYAGVHLDDSDVDRWHQVLANQPDGGKTSMLQDVEAGRRTEVDVFAGKVIALGERYRSATPYNQAVASILRGVGAPR